MILQPKAIRVSNPDLTKKFGLGDAVEKIAKPVSRIVDGAFLTNLANCSGCGKRKEKLNQLVPDLKNPFSK